MKRVFFDGVDPGWCRRLAPFARQRGLEGVHGADARSSSAGRPDELVVRMSAGVAGASRVAPAPGAGPRRIVLVAPGELEAVAWSLRRDARTATIDLAEAPDRVVEDFVALLREDAWRPVPGLLGHSAAARRMCAAVTRAAAVPSTVLVTGPTGTGKTEAARRVHALSLRAASPFVHVDCASLAPSLLESELFGHERGAFTGAAARRRGRFESAGRGTILLDEIGELDAALQAKFLRIIEEREYERVGGAASLRVEARIVAATHRSLEEAVESGRFRSDLLYRLSVVPIEIPGLERRRADIPLLVESALDEVCARLALPRPALEECFAQRLTRMAWPGHVRQLVNAVERVLVHSEPGTLDPDELDRIDAANERRRAGARAMRVVRPPATPERTGERERVAELLVASGGNIARVARRLGIPRTTAQYRIERLGLRHLIPVD